MEDELSAFDFELSLSLGMSVEQMRRSLSNAEYLQWVAWTRYRAAMREMDK